MTKYIELPVKTKPESNQGYEINGKAHWVRLCAVDPDGTVSAMDDVSGHYTTCHSLSVSQQTEARRIADV
jgi:hypothetical protein